MSNKRVTVTVELIEGFGSNESVVWSYSETAEHSTGDNPLHHWSDAQIALDSAGGHAIRAVQNRFGDFRDL